MRRLLLSLAVCCGVIGLAACAPVPRTPDLLPAPPGAAVETVFLATQHGEIQSFRNFGNPRQARTRYLFGDISIPPGHQPGKIETAARIDPNKHFSLVEADELDRAAFTARLRTATRGSDVIGIFVHGYNTNLLDAGMRVAQLQHDFQIDFPLVAFAWPSSGEVRGYVYDRDSVLFARDGLVSLIRMLRQETGRRVMIVAHSMGTLLTMEALRQLALEGDGSITALVDHVVLVSPDIDPDVFRRHIAAIDRLPQPFLVLSAQRDGALRLSGFLTGTRARLGTLTQSPALEARGVTFVDVTGFGDEADRLGHNIPFRSPQEMQSLIEGLERLF